MPDARNLINLMAVSVPHDIPHLFIELIRVMKKCSKADLVELKTEYVRPTVVDAWSGSEQDMVNKEIKEKQ